MSSYAYYRLHVVCDFPLDIITVCGYPVDLILWIIARIDHCLLYPDRSHYGKKWKDVLLSTSERWCACICFDLNNVNDSENVAWAKSTPPSGHSFTIVWNLSMAVSTLDIATKLMSGKNAQLHQAKIWTRHSAGKVEEKNHVTEESQSAENWNRTRFSFLVLCNY